MPLMATYELHSRNYRGRLGFRLSRTLRILVPGNSPPGARRRKKISQIAAIKFLKTDHEFSIAIAKNGGEITRQRKLISERFVNWKSLFASDGKTVNW
jgi:hypothetical protein